MFERNVFVFISHFFMEQQHPLLDLTPMPSMTLAPGLGAGMAVSPRLGLLALTCNINATIYIYTYRDLMFDLHSTLGGPVSLPQLHFDFNFNGCLAFTDPAAHDMLPLLLVSDRGNQARTKNAVHVINVLTRDHLGYVAPPGSIGIPSAVASKGSLVAVRHWNASEATIQLYHGEGSMWTPLRSLVHSQGFWTSAGFRFTNDGSHVILANCGCACLSLFRVSDGAFVKHFALGIGHRDVESWGDGWLTTCWRQRPIHLIEVHGDDDDDVCHQAAWRRNGGAGPLMLAHLPFIGFAVRDYNSGHVQVLASQDTIAMARMSPLRVLWITTVVKSAHHSFLQRQQ